MGIDLANYIPVPERMVEFYRQFPDGRIISSAPQVRTVGDRTFIEVQTSVYRTPDDPLPCVASAWEPFPGRTQFTKESEMMNAETSAIGRALAAAGIMVSRSLASREEVRNRQEDPDRGQRPAQKPAGAPRRDPGADDAPGRSDATEAKISEISARIAALPDSMRKQAKEDFVERFGRPSDMETSRIPEALLFVENLEAV